MIDSTSTRATHAASGGGQKWGRRNRRTMPLAARGGLTTKIHRVCDAHGYPLSFTLSPGQHADSACLAETLDQMFLPGRRERLIKRAARLLPTGVTAAMRCGATATDIVSVQVRSGPAPETEAGATPGVWPS